jgi:hypothetical protein
MQSFSRVLCVLQGVLSGRLLYVLQGVQSGRHLSDYHALWQELRQLSRKMGECFCYIYGSIIVIWFAAFILSLYGGLIGIFNRGIHLRGATLLFNALMCTLVLFVISDGGQRVCVQVSFIVCISIVHLSVCVNMCQQILAHFTR